MPVALDVTKPLITLFKVFPKAGGERLAHEAVLRAHADLPVAQSGLIGFADILLFDPDPSQIFHTPEGIEHEGLKGDDGILPVVVGRDLI